MSLSLLRINCLLNQTLNWTATVKNIRQVWGKLNLKIFGEIQSTQKSDKKKLILPLLRSSMRIRFIKVQKVWPADMSMLHITVSVFLFHSTPNHYHQKMFPTTKLIIQNNFPSEICRHFIPNNNDDNSNYIKDLFQTIILINTQKFASTSSMSIWT